MNGFINHIINRHLKPDNNIAPRIPGRFEQANQTSQSRDDTNMIEQNDQITPTDIQKKSKNLNTFQQAENDYKNNFTPHIKDDTAAYEQLFTDPNEIAESAKEHLIISSNADESWKNDELIINNPEFHNDMEMNNYHEDLRVGQNEKKEIINNFFSEYREADANKKKENKPDSVNSSLYQINFSPQQKNVLVNNISHRETVSHDQLPVIKVSIGRIDVRAIVSTQPEKKVGNAAQKPNMTLENYLKNRNGDKS